MNIVISDTTALIVLAKSDTLFFLSNLFKNVYVPQAVHDELVFKDDIIKYRIKNFEKIILKKITDLNTFRRIKQLKIDIGEIEAISLAIELNLTLVIDEKKGRKIAIEQGLNIVGVLGILIENYRQKFLSLDEAHYYFNIFKKNGLRISKELEKVFFSKLKEVK